MSSLFADTHNVVAILEKSDAAEGFEQIIDFLSGSYIHYALTVNPHIYISCIKQFWNTTFVKRLDDTEGVVCLPNEEIFTGLAQMGYEKPSTKLTFYKAFFFSQWKFLIHIILQSLSAKRTSWNEFSTEMASVNQVGDLSTHTTRFISPALTQKVFANMRRVGKDFPTHIQQVLDVCSALSSHVGNLEHDNAAQKLEIIKLKARVKKLEMANKVKSSKLRRLRKVEASRRIESSDNLEDVFNQRRMINNMDKDEEIELVVTTAKLITDVVTASLQVSAASAIISVAKPSIHAAAPTVVAAYTRRRNGVIIRDSEEELSLKTPAKTPAETPKVKDKGKGILVETSKPMMKKDQIELDPEYARKLHEEINRDHEEFNKDIDLDAVMDHVNQKSNNPQYIKRYQGMKKRPQTESEARKNMLIYLKNTAGYKMDFFKGMMYAQICPIFQARFDENMRKLSEEAQEAEDLRKRLEVVDDEDDDVFIKATPLARKVPVVDYQIVLVDNIPRFKIIKA
nr:hypothetical protein [Tanacetum cinerariifolium]